MVKDDEGALICDFAEYYQIFDYKALPLRTVATLATGLRAESRTMGRIAGIVRQPHTGLTLVQILDTLNILAWMVGGNKSDRPKPNIAYYYEQPKTGFRSGADFELARAEIIKKVNGK